MGLTQSESDGKLVFRGNDYVLTLDRSDPRVAGVAAHGKPVLDLVCASCVNRVGELDSFAGLDAAKVRSREGSVLIEIPVRSDIWKSKVVRFELEPESIRYNVEVEGRGTLDRIEYFGGMTS